MSEEFSFLTGPAPGTSSSVKILVIADHGESIKKDFDRILACMHT
jgi:hypothetical protein